MVLVLTLVALEIFTCSLGSCQRDWYSPCRLNDKIVLLGVIVELVK